MNSNPLKTFVFVSVLNSLYRIYQILIKGIFSPFGIIALILSSIFLFLYFKNSKYTGAFLFYSAVPLYPLYFLAGFLGLNATPPSAGLYLVMALIDVVCLFLVWKNEKQIRSVFTGTTDRFHKRNFRLISL